MTRAKSHAATVTRRRIGHGADAAQRSGGKLGVGSGGIGLKNQDWERKTA
ncbi:MAG: hypothetical protein V3U93_10975 [Alphaproteobacteria bacterium]